MNHGDLRTTIQRIIDLAKAHPDDPFYAIWEATRDAPPGYRRLERVRRSDRFVRRSS